MRQARRATLVVGVITGGAIPVVTGDDTGGDMGDATRWLTYDDMAAALGITPESAKRLAMRRKWPRRPGNDGRALVAVPEDRLTQAAKGDATDDGEGDDTGGVTGDVTGEGRGDARALIGFLERRIDELSEELAEARTEARGARFEAETLRVQAGRVDVLTALLDVERTRVVEARAETEARVEAGQALLEAVRAERDRLLVQVDERRRPWWGRLIGQRRA